MTLSQQVCSLELAKRLKELGVKQESLFWWHESLTNRSEKTGFERLKTGKFYLHQSKGDYSAFTVAELGEMLPDGTGSYKTAFKGIETPWLCRVDVRGDGYIATSGGDTEADARAKMLIYLLENKLV